MAQPVPAELEFVGQHLQENGGLGFNQQWPQQQQQEQEQQELLADELHSMTISSMGDVGSNTNLCSLGCVSSNNPGSEGMNPADSTEPLAEAAADAAGAAASHVLQLLPGLSPASLPAVAARMLDGSQVSLGKRLGSGAFATVYQAQLEGSRAKWVVKRLDRVGSDHMQQVSNEVEVLTTAGSHPNLVPFKGWYMDASNVLCLLLGHCEGGTLTTLLKSRAAGADEGLFPEDMVLCWFVQLLLALHHLHARRILHRDLKPDNVLLSKNLRVVRLADFGISKQLEAGVGLAMTCLGTPHYMSPEVITHRPYTFASDMWALGAVLYEMAARRPAFDARGLPQLVVKILRNAYTPLPLACSRPLQQLVGMLLRADPDDRPTTADLLGMGLVRKHLQQLVGLAQGAAAGGVGPPRGLGGSAAVLAPAGGSGGGGDLCYNLIGGAGSSAGGSAAAAAGDGEAGVGGTSSGSSRSATPPCSRISSTQAAAAAAGAGAGERPASAGACSSSSSASDGAVAPLKAAAAGGGLEGGRKAAAAAVVQQEQPDAQDVDLGDGLSLALHDMMLALKRMARIPLHTGSSGSSGCSSPPRRRRMAAAAAGDGSSAAGGGVSGDAAQAGKRPRTSNSSSSSTRGRPAGAAGGSSSEAADDPTTAAAAGSASSMSAAAAYAALPVPLAAPGTRRPLVQVWDASAHWEAQQKKQAEARYHARILEQRMAREQARQRRKELDPAAAAKAAQQQQELQLLQEAQRRRQQQQQQQQQGLVPQGGSDELLTMSAEAAAAAAAAVQDEQLQLLLEQLRGTAGGGSSNASSSSPSPLPGAAAAWHSSSSSAAAAAAAGIAHSPDGSRGGDWGLVDGEGGSEVEEEEGLEHGFEGQGFGGYDLDDQEDYSQALALAASAEGAAMGSNDGVADAAGDGSGTVTDAAAAVGVAGSAAAAAAAAAAAGKAWQLVVTSLEDDAFAALLPSCKLAAQHVSVLGPDKQQQQQRGQHTSVTVTAAASGRASRVPAALGVNDDDGSDLQGLPALLPSPESPTSSQRTKRPGSSHMQQQQQQEPEQQQQQHVLFCQLEQQLESALAGSDAAAAQQLMGSIYRMSLSLRASAAEGLAGRGTGQWGLAAAAGPQAAAKPPQASRVRPRPEAVRDEKAGAAFCQVVNQMFGNILMGAAVAEDASSASSNNTEAAGRYSEQQQQHLEQQGSLSQSPRKSVSNSSLAALGASDGSSSVNASNGSSSKASSRSVSAILAQPQPQQQPQLAVIGGLTTSRPVAAPPAMIVPAAAAAYGTGFATGRGPSSSSRGLRGGVHSPLSFQSGAVSPPDGGTPRVDDALKQLRGHQGAAASSSSSSSSSKGASGGLRSPSGPAAAATAAANQRAAPAAAKGSGIGVSPGATAAAGAGSGKPIGGGSQSLIVVNSNTARGALAQPTSRKAAAGVAATSSSKRLQVGVQAGSNTVSAAEASKDAGSSKGGITSSSSSSKERTLRRGPSRGNIPSGSSNSRPGSSSSSRPNSSGSNASASGAVSAASGGAVRAGGGTAHTSSTAGKLSSMPAAGVGPTKSSSSSSSSRNDTPLGQSGVTCESQGAAPTTAAAASGGKQGSSSKAAVAGGANSRGGGLKGASSTAAAALRAYGVRPGSSAGSKKG